MGAEVLDHDFGLLGDVVRVQAHEAGQGLGGLLLVDLGVVLDGLDQPEVGLVGRVVLQHVEDEALLDGLAHAVEVEGLRLAVGVRAPEDLQRLVLRRGGEGEEAEVGLLAAFGHGLDDFFLVVGEILFCRLAAACSAMVCAGQHRLHLGGALAGLRAVGLVDDHRIAALGQLRRSSR